MCIGAMDQGLRVFHTIDSFRHILATRSALQLQTREFPVSLLRLYFSGQQHLCALIERLDHHTLATLCELAVQDGHTTVSDDTVFGNTYDMACEQNRHTKCLVHNYLCRVLDWALCSFERTLCAVYSTPDLADWPLFGLHDALKREPYWNTVPTEPLQQSRIWFTCVWRCHVTLQLEKLLKPWLDDSQQEWVQYQLQLFRDTHLDLFSVMVYHEQYDDEALAQQLLPLNWPACDRVLCAEELPDMASYMMDNFKTGSHLKSRKTLRDKLGHILFNKTMNNICKDRNFFDILVRDGEQDEMIYDLVKLISRCALLGNLKKARGSLCLMGRIRCTISFWPELADRVMSLEELSAQLPIHRNPSATEQAKREKKRAKERKKGTSPERIEQLLAQLKRKQEKASYEKTCFKIWILKCPYLVASLMKEFMFNVMEEARSVDELLSVNLKWRHYKDVVRVANGKCRLEITRQVCAVPMEPLDWTILESVEKPEGRTYEIKRGNMIDYHALTLLLTTKAMKRDFMGIVRTKGTSTEGNIQPQQMDVRQVWRDDDSDPGDTRPTLDQLHFVCWYMALRLQKNPVLETRWFQALGMSKAGCEQLRDWLFRYCTEELADDSLKREIEAFRQRSLYDYVLMKTVFEMVNYERRACRLFCLPVEMGIRQVNALRRQLKLHDWEPTPPLLGVAYQCKSCMKFANAVVQPLEFVMQSNYCELVRAKNQVYNENYPRSTHPRLDGFTNHNLVLGLKARGLHVLEYCSTQVARTGTSKSERHDVRDPDYDKEKHIEELEEEEYKRRRENISFLNVAFYNVDNGRLYCVRSRRQRVIVNKESTGQANVVMQCLRRPTRIESTHFTTRMVTNNSPSSQTNEQQPSHTGRGKRKQAVDDDDDDDIDNEEADRRGGDQDDDFRPTYESNPLLFNPDVATLREKGREYLAQWFSGQTGTVMTDEPVTATPAPQSQPQPATQKIRKTAAMEAAIVADENKKKRIAKLVGEPLTRIYSCQKPLQTVDMLRVVKNGKVLCVECGVMTEHCSFSMSPHGPVCMRHANVAFPRHHPVWQMDAPSTVYMNRRQAYDSAHDVDLPNKYTPPKKRPHPADVIGHDRALFYRCESCHTEVPTVYVPYSDEQYALKRAMCCLTCYRRVRPLLMKQFVLRRHQLIK